MNRRESLRQFLEDGRIPLETNTVERSIRPVAMLRKNQNFMQTLDGMNAVANMPLGGGNGQAQRH